MGAPDVEGNAVLEAQQALLGPAQVGVALLPRQAPVAGGQLPVDCAQGGVELGIALPLQPLLVCLQPACPKCRN